MNRRKVGIVVGFVLGILFLLALLGYIFRDDLTRLALSPTESSVEERVETGDREIATVQSGLVTPWSITFMPNQDMIVSERSGSLTRFGDNGQSFEIEGVRETSEGGLLGVALHPEFEQNNLLYLYMTTEESGTLTNRIDRYQLSDDRLEDRMEILSDIPAASNHNGGAIAFGPDEKLYVTTGDAATPDAAQDQQSLAGKILRLNDDGSTPDDNPFENAVWSYGHRNPQGIAWDDQDQLWSVEHGPSGVETGRDELNKIQRGANYGWPEITGDETRDGMVTPVAQSGTDDTWAPAGLAHVDGVLYFAGLRGQSLYEAEITSSGDDVTLTRSLTGEYGRLRAVTAHDGSVYVSTSNRDGRGTPVEDDDRVIQIQNP